jgi:plasmid maintenance system antidote protein VapI
VNLARRLGAYFEGSDAEYWLRLNATCELRRACLADNGKTEREIKPRRSV